MGQATATSNLLQLHHNFRWVLCSTHAEPVAGFLQRHLRRRLIAAGTARPRARCDEAGQSSRLGGPHTLRDDDSAAAAGDADAMFRVVNWLPRAWQHVNRFLESRGSTTDVTIGIIPCSPANSLFCFPLFFGSRQGRLHQTWVNYIYVNYNYNYKITNYNYNHNCL